MEKIIQRAYEMAREAREHSYSPFSKFKVGAAVVLRGQDNVFSGCNVENSSYGGTICAERAAIVSAVTHTGAKHINAVVVVTDEDEPAVPCAICLQVIAEFADASTRILLADMKGIKKEYTLGELLPVPFIFRR